MPEFFTVEQIFLRVRRRCRNGLGRPNEAFYSPDMAGFDGEQQAGMATNRANWDSRVPIHTGPDGYRIDGLVENPTALTDIVNFDRSYLGDLTGVDLVHLQCHVGTDTIALARLGASITGLDFSPAAIAAAKDLAARCDIPARFVEGNVYDAPEVLGQTYDKPTRRPDDRTDRPAGGSSHGPHWVPRIADAGRRGTHRGVCGHLGVGRSPTPCR